MLYERLEIVRRTANGDVYRRITCLAGRVTVFRARESSDIELYQNVLRCPEQDSRFSVLIDSRPFSPQDSIFTGCENDLLAESSCSIWEYLKSSGLPGDQIPVRLAEVGLDSIAGVNCQELTPEQRRVVVLIGLSCISDKIIILDDPFLGIPSAHTEVLARRLADSVWRNRIIVVVTRLTARPESWVENEHITRVQLERPRERTIGFGGGELSSTEFIQAFRAQLKQSETADIEPGKRKLLVESGNVCVVPPIQEPVSPEQQEPIVTRSRPRGILTAVSGQEGLDFARIWKGSRIALLGVGSAVTVICALSLVPSSAAKPARPAKSEPTTPVVTAGKAPIAVIKTQQQPVEAQREMPKPRELLAEQATGTSVADSESGILAQYPVNIRNAVYRSFYEPQNVLKDLPTVSYNRGSPVEQQPKLPTEEFTSPPYAGVGGETIESPPNIYASGGEDESLVAPNTTIEDVPQQSPEELQAQRELLRKAFIDAVARARERQMQEQQGGDYLE